jgi:hypothetical protein
VYLIDPHLELDLARRRQVELERYLELRRQLAEARVETPGLARLALISLGDTLVDVGLRLRERYAMERMVNAR